MFRPYPEHGWQAINPDVGNSKSSITLTKLIYRPHRNPFVESSSTHNEISVLLMQNGIKLVVHNVVAHCTFPECIQIALSRWLFFSLQPCKAIGANTFDEISLYDHPLHRLILLVKASARGESYLCSL